MGSIELPASSGLATIEWHGINWAAGHRRVRSRQRRIVQAIQAGAWRKVKRLSYRLVPSFAARALAVKRVAENHGKKTPGRDGELWDTPEQQAAAVRMRSTSASKCYVRKPPSLLPGGKIAQRSLK